MDRFLYSSAFKNIFWKRHDGCHEWEFVQGEAIELNAAIPPTQHIVMVGENEELGSWKPENGLKFMCEKLPVWFAPTDQINLVDGDEFKFVIMENNKVVAWESGENRRWNSNIRKLGEFRDAPTYRPKFTGVAIPIFSIRNKGCEGIGDFAALGDFALWAAAKGHNVVQILPINDTTITHTRKDSYPYNSISIFALHPLYIRVSLIDPKMDVSPLVALEKLPELDYEQVDQLKWQMFREIYARKGATTLASDEFNQFMDRNQSWLKPYAAFSMLRDKFNNANFDEWPSPYNTYSKDLETTVIAENPEQIGLYYFLQFHADKQLHDARDKANEAGVALKGDVPIGVSRQSVETWSEHHLFNMDGQAGSPPDDFSSQGQNWGFPTYNWEKMANDGYEWWKARLRKMAEYFDIYRIDHILGFFRIWEIPMPIKNGLMGHFSPALPYTAQELEMRWGLPMYEERYIGVDNSDPNTLYVRDHKNPKLYHPRIAAQFTDRYQNTLDWYEKERFNAIYNHYFYERNNQFWADQAFKKLPQLIGATDMLCCAEDLGMIPATVAKTLEVLGILSLEIERMPKCEGCLFGDLSKYPYLSVASTSTHDMSPLRLWWDEDREMTQRYYNEQMHWWGAAPNQATVEVCRNIIERHKNSPSMVVILPLQDWSSVDLDSRVGDPASERINIPSQPDHYWRYRMLGC